MKTTPVLDWKDTPEMASSEDEAATCAHSDALAGEWSISVFDVGEIDIQVTWHKVLTAPGSTIEQGKRLAEAVLHAQQAAALTSEYVSGWLAGRVADAALFDGETLDEGATGNDVAKTIRALAPPSAPPVQRPDSDGFKVWKRIEEQIKLRDAEIESMRDRMLLLKALLDGDASLSEIKLRLVYVMADGRMRSFQLDNTNIVTPDLRAALIKATEATHE